MGILNSDVNNECNKTNIVTQFLMLSLINHLQHSFITIAHTIDSARLREILLKQLCKQRQDNLLSKHM